MLKAIFIDHMGTLVYEQSEWLEKLMDMCVQNSNEKDPQKLADLWYQKHDELLAKYNGDNYKSEYDISLEAFECIKMKLDYREIVISIVICWYNIGFIHQPMMILMIF